MKRLKKLADNINTDSVDWATTGQTTIDIINYLKSNVWNEYETGKWNHLNYPRITYIDTNSTQAILYCENHGLTNNDISNCYVEDYNIITIKAVDGLEQLLNKLK